MLLKRILNQLRRPTQSAPPVTPVLTPEWHAEQAAKSLYNSVRPDGGLTFYGLSEDQRQYYRAIIAHAQALTDLTRDDAQKASA